MNGITDLIEAGWAEVCESAGIFVCISSETGHGKSVTLNRIIGDTTATRNGEAVIIGELRCWCDKQEAFDLLMAVANGERRLFTTICASSAIEALQIISTRIHDRRFWGKVVSGSLVGHQKMVNGVDPFQSYNLSEELQRGKPQVKDIVERLKLVAGSSSLHQVRFTNVEDPVVEYANHGLPYGMIKLEPSGRLKLVLRETLAINDEMKLSLQRDDWPSVLSQIESNGFQSLRKNAIDHVLWGRLDPFEFERHFGGFDRFPAGSHSN